MARPDRSVKECACCASKGGTYDFECLDCCARLVASAYPNKLLAMGLLECIERYRTKWGSGNGPRRDQILAKVQVVIGVGLEPINGGNRG